MLNKKELLRCWKDVNLAEVGILKFVRFGGLTEGAKMRIMGNYGFKTEEEAEDEYYYIGSDVDEWDIRDWSQYEEELLDDLFESEMDFLFDNLFGGKYQYFLCHNEDCDWMGNSSYQFYELNDLKNGNWFPDYDHSTYLVDRLKRGKVAEFKQCHHDVPRGHPVYLIGLTTDEYYRLDDWHENYQRSNIQAFAESKIYE